MYSIEEMLRKAKEEEEKPPEPKPEPKPLPPPPEPEPEPEPEEEKITSKCYGMRLPNYEDVIDWILKHPKYPISQKTLRKDPRAWAGLGSTILNIAEKIINEEG